MIERRKLPRVNKDCHISIFVATEQTILLTMSLIERGIYATLRTLYCLHRESLLNEKKRYNFCEAETNDEKKLVDSIFHEFFYPCNEDIDNCFEKQKKNSKKGKDGSLKRWENNKNL